MKKIAGIIIIVALFSCGQLKEDGPCCLLVTQHSKELLYDAVGGHVVDSIINDTINEDYVFLTLMKIKQDYAYITAEYMLGNGKHVGWIPKSKIGINPATTGTIYLYSGPNSGSEVTDSIVSPNWGSPFSIETFKGEWLYIHYRGHEGWLSPEDACCNPYTSCN
jgi:hypothetical protein